MSRYEDDLVNDGFQNGRQSDPLPYEPEPPQKIRENGAMVTVVSELLLAGYELSVFDGQYETVSRTVVRDVILNGMRKAPVDHLLAYRAGHPDAEGWVRIEYVTDGPPVITRSPGMA